MALVPSGTGVSGTARTVVDDSAIDEAFAKAEVVISQRMMNQRLAPIGDGAAEAWWRTSSRAKAR